MRIIPSLAFALVPAALLLGGCLARAAVDVVTLPVKAVGYGVDKVTTSQAEADRNGGREIRHKEEDEERARRKAAREEEKRERDGG